MGILLKFPPCIRHIERPEQELQNLIVDRALQNLRVPKAACKLMKFYAARSDGFRPSLKMISGETGLNEYNISRTRTLLYAYGLIGYDGATVIIDWCRLKAFAAIDASQMGQKRKWTISPVSVDLLGRTKNDLHTYRERDSEAKNFCVLYEATRVAIEDGVEFPELKGVQMLGHTKNDLHTYIGNENSFPYLEESCGWYDPFSESDPSWVYQVPVCDAYGEIVSYAHYNIELPF